MDDNPSLSETIKEEYRRMFSGVWKSRFIDGKWVIANGIIYDMFNDEKHIVKDSQIPYDEIDKWCIGVDYGTGNSTCFLLLGRVDDIIYVVGEYYFAGRQEAQEQGDFEAQKTDLEYAEDMRQFIRDYYDLTGLNYRNIDIMVDPAANSFILQMRRLKMKSKRAVNDVLDGIRTVATYFGSDRLFISENCKNLIGEIHTYSWDEKAQARGVDSPKKENDHACLCGNTLVYTSEGYIQIEDLVGRSGFVYTDVGLRPFYNVCKTRENAKVVKSIFSDGSYIISTPDHFIMTDNGWQEVGKIENGCNIICLYKTVKLVSKEDYGCMDVYNMNVDDVHRYAITESNIIIKNCDALRYGIMKLKDKDKLSNATRNVGLW